MTIELVKIDEHGFPAPDTPDPVTVRPLWESIDPCAFLCFCVQNGSLQLDAVVAETLDAFGWMNADRTAPDYHKMNREFQRYQNSKGVR